jgi:hypothetical protein
MSQWRGQVAVRKDVWETPAVKGDVAGPTIKTSIAIDLIISALLKLQKGDDITQDIEDLREQSRELDEMFDELTGWKSE